MWSLLGWVTYPACSHLCFLISLIHWCFFIQFRMMLQKLLGNFSPHLKKMSHWLLVSIVLFPGAWTCSRFLRSFAWFERSMSWMEAGVLCVSSFQWAPGQSCVHLFLVICVWCCGTCFCLWGCCCRKGPPVIIPKGISSSPSLPVCPVSLATWPASTQSLLMWFRRKLMLPIQ